MQAKILSITRPEERLLGAPEVAARLDIDVRKARELMTVYGLRLGRRYYITAARLHEALAELQARKT